MDEVVKMLVAGGMSEEAAREMLSAMTSEAVKAAEGKAAGITAAKKKAQEASAQTAAELEKVRKELEELQAKGMSESERMKLDAEKLKLENEKLKAMSSEQSAKYEKHVRDAKIAELSSGIGWIEDVRSQLGAHIVAQGLEGIEDLSDKSSIDAAIEKIRSENSGLIKAVTPSGTGSKSSGYKNNNENNNAKSDFDIKSLAGKTGKEKMAAIDAEWNRLEAVK